MSEDLPVELAVLYIRVSVEYAALQDCYYCTDLLFFENKQTRYRNQDGSRKTRR